MAIPQQSWQRVTELFEQALEYAPEARAEFLTSACGSNLDLLQEVESLLAEHEAEANFLESPAVAAVADQLAKDGEHSSVGKQLGHYRIEALLGRGGMGEVYLAQDKLGRKVALKLLTQRFPGDRSGTARFQQEARTLLALNHPHIMTIHDIDQIEGVYYIASELVEGETLRRRLDENELGLEDVLEIAIQVATALAAAHEKGIVHRDIKPENIMIRRDGFVKVLDFGIAKLTEKYPTGESEATTLRQAHTAEGTVVGTAPYMSPEQARGLKVDARTDIWSLGVVIYEAVAGRKPFSGETTADIISSVIDKTPAPLNRYASELPEELEWIVSRALRKEKEGRYQTANELMTDLKQLRTKIEIAKASGELLGRPALSRPTPVRDPRNTAASAPSTYVSSAEYIAAEIKRHKLAFILCLLVLAAGIVGLSVYLKSGKTSTTAEHAIQSLAVLPFKNESANPDLEYLSDGMTDTLINNLSQLPRFSVKARTSVFRYKGKEIEPQKAASDLSVEAILNGRLVQRGDDLTLYLSLVDGRNGNQLWGEQYSRKMTDLVALQNEIARDVSRKLRARLSGPDEQKVARNYTENTEAYQLYLRGRYHHSRLTRPEIDKAIAYYQQAIAIDQSYALAYIGLSQAYRTLALTSEAPANETLPKAKAAALRAIEIDETLAEAHSALGIVAFRYEWDWKAAERHFLRALELDPSSTQLGYAQLLWTMGQHEKALIEAKRSRELDPLDLRISSLEGQVLFFAGRYEESIDRLQKTLELDSNFWLAHLFLSRVYIEKKMHPEAIAEATKATNLTGGNSEAIAQVVYALAKAGQQKEARMTLDELKKRAAERYVPPYAFALSYNGLGETDQAIAWLEKGIKERDVKMTLLLVDPQWNNLRSDTRFQDLLKRMGLSS
jgi:eukaryotic-like serine/threonine-protein kinase